MLKMLLEFLITLLGQSKSQPSVQKPSVPASPQKAPESQPTKQVVKVEIDWNNPAAKVSKYFTVKETTYLPSWGISHIPSEEEKKNIVALALIMDKVRELINLPIGVHVWMRPGSVNCPGSQYHGQDYNAFIKGAKRSPHKQGQGIDWSAKGLTCDEIRKKLEPKLEELGLRMEDLPGSNWVHNDTYPASVSGGRRFFKP